jgi:internalin A
MPGWNEISQQLQQIINEVIRFAKARRREEAAIGIAAILFWVGYSIIKWLPEELQDFVKSWRGDLIVPAVFYAAGLIFLSYGFYRIWKLVFTPDLPPPTNRPSAIKGPLAFTEADGELFRKLGREDELRKLLGYVEDDQVRLVVLMGASGAGKTSLLRAGLTDILKDKNIKLHYWEAVPTDSGKALLRAIQEDWNKSAGDKTNGSNPPASPVEPKSLDDLINPSPDLRENKHVVVLDQFEQLRGLTNGQVFKLLQKVARKAKPPYSMTWIVAFRREFRADWSDFMIPEHENGFYPPEISLRLFTSEQARDVISQLILAAGLSIQQKVIDNLIEAATVEGEVSSVDIGIGLLILSELSARYGGKTITEEDYHFAGGAEGLLTQYIDRCLNIFPDEDRETILNAMLALRDVETNQRIAEGKTCAELAEETKADARRLKTQLERLTQRDMRLLEHVTLGDEDKTRYRLPHERLIPALNRSAGKLLGELEEAKGKFVGAFTAWRKNNASQYLLRGKDLRLVERYKSQIPWGKDETEKLNFLKRSKRHRALKRLMSAVLIITLLASGWLANSQYQRYDDRKYLKNNNYPPELYDWQHQLKVLELNEPFNTSSFPWLHSNTIEEFTIKVADSTNSLDGLVDSLTKCPALKKLNLDLSYSQVNNIEVLSKLTNLTQLNLSLSSEVNDIEVLSKLTNLTQLNLDLNDSEVNNIEVLSKLTNLAQLNLDLGSGKVNDIKVLSKLTNLTQLNLSLREVNNIEMLSKLTNLTQLNLSLSSEVNDIEVLSKLTNLTQLTLNLGSSKVNDIEVLSKLTNLTQLNLNLGSSREVNDIEVLSKLTNLTQLTLNLGNSKVNDIEVLSKLTNLTQLNLNLGGSREVNNIEVLSKLTNLTQLTLNLGSSKVNDIEVLSKLTNLTELNLSLGRSRVNNIEVLSRLTNLTQLTLSFSDQVIDIKVLGELTNLTQLNLDLSYSKANDIEVLSRLTNLTQLTLDLSYSQVRNLEPLSKLNCDTLELYLTTEQRMSLKTIPKSVTHLKL